MSDLYRDYIHANFSLEDMEPEPQQRCAKCGAFLSWKPDGETMVADKPLKWESGIDEDGYPYSFPTEFSYAPEPFWTCKKCGHSQ